jgi:hypothetical protein
MVYREVSMIEIREALRAWLAGKSERAVAAQAGVDRKTSKRYVTAAVAAGLSREGGEKQLTDELVGQVASLDRSIERNRRNGPTDLGMPIISDPQ